MSGGGSFANLGFHVGSDWRADCHAYADSTPILSLRAGSAAVSISIADCSPGEAAVRFAQALARQAQAFAAEVERLHAGHDADAGDGSGTRAADADAA